MRINLDASHTISLFVCDMDLNIYIEAYSLKGPLAGNIYLNVYTPFITDTYLCMFSRCLGGTFPGPIPGVNDGSDCKRK